MRTDPIADAIMLTADRIAATGRSKRHQYVALRTAYLEMSAAMIERLTALEAEIVATDIEARDARHDAYERMAQDQTRRGIA